MQAQNAKIEFSYPLSSESIQEMERHTKYDEGEEQSHFDKISTNYDDIMKTVGYPDPELIAQKAQSIAAQQMISRTMAEIADFGCGTGLVGEALAKNGFKQV